MRDFGVLKGPDLVPVLTTLLQEGALADPKQVLVLKAVHQELRTHIELYYQANQCVHAHISDDTYRLEQVLYRKRLLDRSQLDELQELLKTRSGRSLTQLILEKKWISEAELTQVVNHLTEIMAYEVLLWKETSFDLMPSRLKVSDYWGTGLAQDKLASVRYFVDNAEKNLPVLILMREKMANPNTLLRRLKELERGQLSDYQYHIYRYINNQHSIRALLQLSDLGYFETFSALYQLISWEYVGLGQLDVPTFARTRHEPAPEARPKAEPKSVPRPSISRLPAPAKPDLELAPVSSGARQFLRRGRGSELLQVLVSVMKSGYADGRIIVDHQQQIIRAEFSLFKGALVHVSTTAFSIRFGDLLVRRGVLAPDQLREALEEQKSNPNTHLGEILQQHGFLNEEAIPKLVEQQMAAVIYEVLAWQDVKFYFDPQGTTPQQEIYQKLSIQAPFEILEGRLNRTDQSAEGNLLEEADRNLPILLTMREQIPSLKAIARRTARPAKSLSPQQERVLKEVDNSSSLQDILLTTDLPYFEAYTALYQLINTGLVELAEAGSENRPAPAPARASFARSLIKAAGRPNPASMAEPIELNLAAASAVALTEPLIDQPTQQLLDQIPAERFEEVRLALQAVLKLAIQG